MLTPAHRRILETLADPERRAGLRPDEREAVRAALETLDRWWNAVAVHHAPIGDNLCIGDDNDLYAAFGLPLRDPWCPPEDQMFESCHRFVRRRCRPHDPALPLPPGMMTIAELEAEVERLARERAEVDHATIAARLECLRLEAEVDRAVAACVEERGRVVVPDRPEPHTVWYWRVGPKSGHEPTRASAEAAVRRAMGWEVLSP
jgi:hypothetical protein